MYLYFQRFLSLNETLTFQSRNLVIITFEPKMQLKRKGSQPGPHGHHFEPGGQTHAQQVHPLSYSGSLSNLHHLSGPSWAQTGVSVHLRNPDIADGKRFKDPFLGVETSTSREAFLGI